jgi:hypothetical protein
MIKDGAELIAYCGLYCGDCAGYSGEIAAGAAQLIELLQRYKFDRTASQLFADQLGDYEEWFEKLEFMAGLKCDAVCRDRDPPCEIGVCCTSKGNFACHECRDFDTCEKLKKNEGLHGDSHLRNLRAMRDLGPEVWVSTGRRLWFAEDSDEVQSRS